MTQEDRVSGGTTADITFEKCFMYLCLGEVRSRQCILRPKSFKAIKDRPTDSFEPACHVSRPVQHVCRACI